MPLSKARMLLASSRNQNEGKQQAGWKNSNCIQSDDSCHKLFAEALEVMIEQRSQVLFLLGRELYQLQSLVI